MTAERRLAPIRIKVQRAAERLDELRIQLDAFTAASPYKVQTKRDPNTRRLIYFLAEVSEPPMIVPLLAGEILQGLRSALDHLAYQLVLIGNGTQGPFRHVYFPICDDAAKYAKLKTAKTDGMRAAALAAIDAFTPFRGGNDVLWRLDKLNNVDKHRLLITVGSAYASFNIAATVAAQATGFSPGVSKLLAGANLFLKPAKRIFPLRAGDELFADLPDAQPAAMSFRFEVALNEPGVCEGAPLFQTLKETVAEVERVLADFPPHLT